MPHVPKSKSVVKSTFYNGNMKHEQIVRVWLPDKGWFRWLLLHRGRKWARVRFWTPKYSSRKRIAEAWAIKACLSFVGYVFAAQFGRRV